MTPTPALVMEHDALAQAAAEQAEAVGEAFDRIEARIGGGEVAEQARKRGERVVAQHPEALAGAVGGRQEMPAHVRTLAHRVGLDPPMACFGDLPGEVERHVGQGSDPFDASGRMGYDRSTCMSSQ